ncbi:AAA family ATPase [Bacillus paranthracis]|uniref:AAA family ATPase n=1 Tax=Bacillus paranthracis TaxID=2026186 RepID=UPI00254DA26B|nr:AAA family ATPase [Bacillus paranthracis]MDK7419264.1 AAA family ATPase [Bacillus paranthracis]MDK7430871.1 AAA family ATPase [Bacillus paranthracis]MDK7516564.1 AAA family ATPase [Bacillus paranthracis]MDK7572398.1 AAA family ATPase [Bacillus paranthracis]
MEKLENVRFNRINYPKGASVVDAGTWTVGTISTGVKKRSKYESISFVADQFANIGIDTKAKYDVVGYYEDGKYGRQFVVKQMKMLIDTSTAKGLEQALTLIMTDLMAGRMIGHFKTPEAVIEAFENRYSTEFLQIQGMTEEKLENYYDLYEEKISGQEAIMELTPLGFTPKQAKDIYKRYKDMEQIMEMLDNAGMYDFYLDGVLKFHEAETIGRARGIDLLNEKRIGALIVAYYKQPFQNDSFFTDQQMNTFIVPYLVNHCGDGLNQKHYNSALSYLRFKEATHRLTNKTGLKIVYDTEWGIYQTIKELQDKIKNSVTVATNVIEDEIKSAPFELSNEQQEAVRIACTNGISIISGNAGAGKSTTLGIITKVFSRLGYDIEQVALSGKAALRIAETTGLEAQTIHRMFAANTKINDEGFKNVPDIGNPYADLTDVGFYKDVLILDEASMVGGAIMLNLMKLLNKSKVKHIIIVGDDAQLPPIGVGQAFTDLLNYGHVPTAKLTKVYRQASESGILASATMIRQNQNFIPSLNTFGADFKYKRSSKGVETIAEFDRMLANNNGDILETQIIAMTNVDVTKINVAIQKHLKIFSEKSYKNKERGIEYAIYEGSKVMLSENQYATYSADGEEDEGDPVFNGNIGIVKQFKDDYMLIDFAGIGEVGIPKESWKALRLGYAITIHKSQGSGFNSVIAIVNDGVPEMLTSNMMYTAITRAKKECTLISPDNVVDRCANKSAAERQTWLPIFYGGKE